MKEFEGITPAETKKIKDLGKYETPAEMEARILAEEKQQHATATLDREDSPNLDRSDRANFSIRAGAKLPEKFVNPPRGDARHLCVDQGGIYRPDWVQIKIHKQHPDQRNPQPFPLGGTTYWVPLGEWHDVHPSVLISLEDAVETRHEMMFKPGDIAVGAETQHLTSEIPRFFYQSKPSA